LVRSLNSPANAGVSGKSSRLRSRVPYGQLVSLLPILSKAPDFRLVLGKSGALNRQRNLEHAFRIFGNLAGCAEVPEIQTPDQICREKARIRRLNIIGWAVEDCSSIEAVSSTNSALPPTRQVIRESRVEPPERRCYDGSSVKAHSNIACKVTDGGTLGGIHPEGG